MLDGLAQETVVVVDGLEGLVELGPEIELDDLVLVLLELVDRAQLGCHLLYCGDHVENLRKRVRT